MKKIHDTALSIIMLGIVVAVFTVRCDASAQAQSRAVNTITRTIARSVARATVTPHTIAPPTQTRVTLEVSELQWLFAGEALEEEASDPTPDGCSDRRARRPDERTWYRVRICGFDITALRRIP